jgi:hypothetical protein
LFSAISTSFAITIQTNLEPDPNDTTAAYLRAILLTLNHSAALGELPTPPTAWSGPAQEIVTATNLLYASLIISLLAAFVAMLGKQWLNRYLRDAGTSVAERCGDRERKRNGIERWPFEMIVESLPVMLQIALLLLGVGLSRYMWVINIPVARTILSLTAFGVVFFILIVVAGTSSYECPFQTPASLTLRALGVHRLFGRLTPFLPSISLPPLRIRQRTGNFGRKLGYSLGYLYSGMQMSVSRIKKAISGAIRRCVALAHTTRDPVIQHDTILRNLSRVAYFGWVEGRVEQRPKVVLSHGTDRADARCINWTFSRIAAPEAIDSAFRLACTIRWYHNGVDPQPSSDAFHSVLRRCFELGRVRPGRRDRAYDTARVICRLYVLAWARSDALADTRRPSPPPRGWADNAADDHDLRSTLALLYAFSRRGEPLISQEDFAGISAAHATWVSDILLYLEWARRDNLERVPFLPAFLLRQNAPLSATAVANILMSACVSLRQPINEEVLLVDDKSCVMGKFLPLTHKLTRFNLVPLWTKSRPTSLGQLSQPPTLVIAHFL